MLVINCDSPGMYLAHQNHVDIPAAVPKYLVGRCILTLSNPC